MSFLDTIRRAKSFLEEQGRVSLRALKLEFGLDDEQLEALVEELVDIQQLAARESKALVWVGPAAAEPRSEGPTAAVDSETVEAERRQLTVLFCDLVDSTRLAAGLDPEEWRELVRGYQQSAAAVVERFEGHVAQYLGDGLLVYFGWPMAHEDDAERAVRAALGIVDGVPAGDTRLAVRVGIHTGPVVVGEMGGGSSRETLAMGETTNVAARIQSEAAPGTVAVSDATLHLVRGIFATEELGRRVLKGMPEPATLHRVIQPSGVRSRLDVARGHWTRFVGREQELGLLLDRWEQAAEGEGQTVLVTGEAGLGKSRLAQILRERVGDQPHTWLECRSSPYTQGSALRPVIELVEQGVRIEPEETAEEKLRKLEEGIGFARLDLQTVVPLMADLLGISTGSAYPPLQLSPELQRERTLDAFVAWTLALGEIQPVLLLVEDLHWCDPSSIELFGRLNEQLPTSPVLMLLTARPEFEVPWTHPKSWTPVALGHLRRRSARELVRSLAEDRSLPEEAVAQILDRADGVPLYLEELTRAALESGDAGSPVTIPATLQDSLMARLDRLSAAKDVAQLASVLGREFPYRLMRGVAGMDDEALLAGLDRLVEADLLFRRGVPPTATYTFKHALVQEAAYGSLLRARRREIHARTAAALEEGTPEPEILARHCEAAGFEQKAAEHFARAGEQAAARSAHREAIALLRQALKLFNALPETVDRYERELPIQTALGASLQLTEGYTSTSGLEAYERARELCDLVRDKERLTIALYGLAAVHNTSGELDAALELADRLCAEAETSGERVHQLMGLYPKGFNLLTRGDICAAADEFQRSSEVYEASMSPWLVEELGQDIGQLARIFHAMTLSVRGEIDAAAAEAEATVETTRRLGHPFTLAFAAAIGAVVFGIRREWQRCRIFAEEAGQVAGDHGFALWSGVGSLLRGWSERGAFEEVREGMALMAGTGNQSLAPLMLGILADTCRCSGRNAEVVSAADLGLTVGQNTKQHFWRPELLRQKGEAFLELADHTEEEAESLFHDAIEVAKSQEARTLELRAATSLARLWQRQGKTPEARDLIQPVYDWFTEGFDTQDLKDAKALLEELT